MSFWKQYWRESRKRWRDPRQQITGREIWRALLTVVVCIAIGIGVGWVYGNWSRQHATIRAATAEYDRGIAALKKGWWDDAVGNFDSALYFTDLPQARAMKAGTLCWLHRYDDALRAYFGNDHKRTRDDKAGRLNDRLEIMNAAVKAEPKFPFFWIEKADTLMGLHVIALKNSSDSTEALQRMGDIKRCYEEAHRLDPTFEPANDRLSQPWVKTLDADKTTSK